MSPKTTVRLALATAIAAVSLAYLNKPVDAQLATPEMVDPDLGVRSVVSGLTTAF